MQGFLNKGKEVLKNLVTNGFEAYFFKETVRNSILKLDCEEIYIMTSASVEELSNIYAKHNFTVLSKDTSKLVMDGFVFIITSFTANKQSNDRVKVVNSNLLDNLASCNFTINALAMTSSGKITDAYDGYRDISKKAIKTVGTAKQRFYDSPIFMLDAMVIISELNFVLSNVCENGIKKRIAHLSKLSPKEVANEMRKILAGRYAKKALITMANLGMTKGLPFFDKALKKYISQAKEYNYDTLVMVSMIENKDVNEDYLETCDDPDQVMMLYNLAASNPKSKFDSLTLFTYGVDACTAAYKLNKLLGHTKGSLEKKIAKEYDALPIKKKCDVKFKGEDIMRISDLRDASEIGDMFEDIVYQVLTGAIPNDYDKLERYACDCLREKGIYFDITRKTIVGIQPRIVENDNDDNHYDKKNDTLSDYDKFINGLNNKKTENDYQREMADDYGKDESKFELPGKPRVQMTKAEFYENQNPNTVYNEEVDDINYNNYRDPSIPTQESINKENEYKAFTNPYNTNGYPFESEFERGKEVNARGEEVNYSYERNVNSNVSQNEIIRKLEERLDAQDKIIRENKIELNKQMIVSSANKVTSGIIDSLNRDQVLPNYIDKNDFEQSLNEFVKEYLNNKMPR